MESIKGDIVVAIPFGLRTDVSKHDWWFYITTFQNKYYSLKVVLSKSHRHLTWSVEPLPQWLRFSSMLFTWVETHFLNVANSWKYFSQWRIGKENLQCTTFKQKGNHISTTNLIHAHPVPFYQTVLTFVLIKKHYANIL